MVTNDKKILAFDTSWDFGVAATIHSGEVVQKVYGRTPRAAGEGLLPWIMEVVGKSSWKKRDIEIIAVGRGPGSFTGTRIAVSVAKGLSEVLEVVLVGVSSMEAVALTFGKPGQALALAMDAKKGEVLFAVYKITTGDYGPAVVTTTSPLLLSPSEAEAALAKVTSELPELRVCGSAIPLYPSLVQSLPQDRVVQFGSREFLIDPLSLSWLALERLRKGESDSPTTLQPVYLR